MGAENRHKLFYATPKINAAIRVRERINKTNLVQELRQKVIENIDNPTKLKIYLDGFMRMDDKVGPTPGQPILQSTVDLKRDFEELRAGRPTEQIKRIVYHIFAYRHPSYGKSFWKLAPEDRKNYREWQQALGGVLEPLFEGRTPLIR